MVSGKERLCSIIYEKIAQSPAFRPWMNTKRKELKYSNMIIYKTMILPNKYCVYPGVIRHKELGESPHLHLYLHNSGLEEMPSYYEIYGRRVSYQSHAKELKEINKLFSEFNDMNAQTRQQVLTQLDPASYGGLI
jgi:hypothetical protein